MIGGVFGLEERAIKLCEDRATLLARNIANTSTPNFKARDFDFAAAMKEANSATTLEVTNAGHLKAANSLSGEKIAYRIPMQSSLDDNTVDDEIERKNFIQNSINYQASLGFAQTTMNTLIRALKGE
jgi:flagellar basal-body rod protein FlgB